MKMTLRTSLITAASADDVTCYKAVGNIHLDCENTINVGTEPIVRNQAIGLGANTVLATGVLGAVWDGVAYSCP
jgi:hypothetical protein